MRYLKLLLNNKYILKIFNLLFLYVLYSYSSINTLKNKMLITKRKRPRLLILILNLMIMKILWMMKNKKN